MIDDQSEARRRELVLLVAVATYVAASLIANVMSVRIVRIAGFSIDAGTLTYPLTFTLRDVVHKVGGRRAARITIIVTAFLNVFMALSLWAAAMLPADAAVGPQREFGQVLVSTWRIVVASITAQVIAELVDTEVYHAVTRRLGKRAQWARVVLSNAVSIPIDSVLFSVIAFSVPSPVLQSIIWANIIVKGVTSLVTWPLIYVVKDPPVLSDEQATDRPRESATTPVGSS